MRSDSTDSPPGGCIAIASGKGGTGKTTVAVNLAVVLEHHAEPVTYTDLDVEAPNGGIFLKPDVQWQEDVTVPVPGFDPEKCKACGRCQDICAFNAIVQVKDKILFFPELCHSCGGCALVCPNGAIIEKPHTLGTIRGGASGDIGFMDGNMHTGQARSTPIIRALVERLPSPRWNILDCPPGTSCQVVASVQKADYVVMVTEPTPFGLHDLDMAVRMAWTMGLPCGAVINRDGTGCGGVESYCRDKGIPILARIPFDRSLAERYSRGEVLARQENWFTQKMEELFLQISIQLKELNLNRLPRKSFV